MEETSDCKAVGESNVEKDTKVADVEGGLTCNENQVAEKCGNSCVLEQFRGNSEGFETDGTAIEPAPENLTVGQKMDKTVSQSSTISPDESATKLDPKPVDCETGEQPSSEGPLSDEQGSPMETSDAELEDADVERILASDEKPPQQSGGNLNQSKPTFKNVSEDHENLDDANAVKTAQDSVTENDAEVAVSEVSDEGNTGLRGILKATTDTTPGPVDNQPSDNGHIENIRIYIKNVAFTQAKNKSKKMQYANRAPSRKVRKSMNAMADKITAACEAAKVKLQQRESDDYLQSSDYKADGCMLYNPWHFKQNSNRDGAKVSTVEDAAKSEKVKAAQHQKLSTEDLQKSKVSDVINFLRYAGSAEEPEISTDSDSDYYSPLENNERVSMDEFGANVIFEVVISPLSKRNLMSEESLETHTFACETVRLVNEFLQSLLKMEGYYYRPDYEIQGVTRHYKEEVGRNLALLGRYWGMVFIPQFKEICEIGPVIGSVDLFEKFIFTFAENFLLTEKFSWLQVVTFFSCCGELATYCANIGQLEYVSTLSHMMVTSILVCAMVDIQEKGGWPAFNEQCTKKSTSDVQA